MKKKYVKMMYAGFILFDESIPHVVMKLITERSGDHIITAGFFYLNEDGAAECYGESIGLKLKSGPDDSAELRKFLGQI